MPSGSDTGLEEKIEELISVIRSSSVDDFRENIEPVIDGILVFKDRLKEIPEELKHKLGFVLVIILQMLNNFENRDFVIEKLEMFKNRKLLPDEWKESFVTSDIWEMVETIHKHAVKD